MTDKDWFAAFAMVGLMDTRFGWQDTETLAGRAYNLAEAMQAEQRKRNKEQLCPEKTTTLR